MRRDVREFLAYALCLSAILYFVGFGSCMAKTQGMTLQTRFALFGGCQVHTPVGWVPLDNYRWVEKGYTPDEGVSVGD